IRKSRKLYRVATTIAAATSLTGNLVLVPRFGPIGAAWTNALAFATLAMVAMRLAQRVYPMTYEWGRIARLAIAGVGAYLLTWLIPSAWPAWLGLLTRGTLVCIAYPLLLLAIGFYHRDETAFVMSIIVRLRKREEVSRATVAEPIRATVAEPIDVAAAMPEAPLAQDGP